MNLDAELYQRLFLFAASFVHALFFRRVSQHPALPAHTKGGRALTAHGALILEALELHLAPLTGMKDAEKITAKMQVSA